MQTMVLTSVTASSPNKGASRAARCAKPSPVDMDDNLQDRALVPMTKGRAWRGGCLANSAAPSFFIFQR